MDEQKRRRLQEMLDQVYDLTNAMREELKPFSQLLVAGRGKPLSECGAGDIVKVAQALLRALSSTESER